MIKEHFHTHTHLPQHDTQLHTHHILNLIHYFINTHQLEKN